MIYGNVFLPKEESKDIFAIESVVFDEYCNRLELLESCTNKEKRFILEAQVQVLQEISFKDIIGKIKELWERFKRWVKGIWDKIFNKEKAQKKEEEKVKKEANKVVNDISKSDNEDNEYKSTAILRDIYFPFWDEKEESIDKNPYLKRCLIPGELKSLLNIYDYGAGKEEEIALLILTNYHTDNLFTNGNGLKDASGNTEAKKYVEHIKEELRKISEFKIYFKPIIELNDDLLNNYRLGKEINKDSKENLIKVNKLFDDAIYKGFDRDKECIKDKKKKIDDKIKKMDKAIEKVFSDENKENEELIKQSQNKINDQKKLNDLAYNSKWISGHYDRNERIIDYFVKDKYEREKLRRMDIDELPDKYKIAIPDLENTKFSDAEECPAGFIKNDTFINKYIERKIDRERMKIEDNKEKVEQIQEYSKSVRAIISSLQSEVNCITNLEAIIISAHDRAISEQKKLVKILKEKYNSDVD